MKIPPQMQEKINQLSINNQALTMSSLEISELAQSRHDSVKRTIETLVNQGVIACPQTVDVQEVKGNNRTYTTQAYLFIGEQGKLDSRNKRTFNHWFIERGLGQMVQTDTGFDQALFTHKGEAWVVEQLISEGVIA